MKPALKEGSIYTFAQFLDLPDDAPDCEVQLVDGPGDNVKTLRFNTRNSIPAAVNPTRGVIAALVMRVEAVVIYAPALVEQGRAPRDAEDESAKPTRDDAAKRASTEPGAENA